MSRFMLNLRQVVDHQDSLQHFHYTSEDVLSSIIGNIGATLDHFDYSEVIHSSETLSNQLVLPSSHSGSSVVKLPASSDRVPV